MGKFLCYQWDLDLSSIENPSKASRPNENLHKVLDPSENMALDHSDNFQKTESSSQNPYYVLGSIENLSKAKASMRLWKRALILWESLRLNPSKNIQRIKIHNENMRKAFRLSENLSKALETLWELGKIFSEILGNALGSSENPGRP